MYAIDPIKIPKFKRFLAGFYQATGIAMFEKHFFRRQKYILAVNYHSTPAKTANAFEKQLQWLAKHFVNIGPQHLADFLVGKWTESKPGVMIHFDDGIKDNIDIAVPLLEKYGFTGWFQLVTSALDNPRFAKFETMSWDDAEELLKRGHIVSCHSSTHKRFYSTLTDSEIEHEVLASREKIYTRLGFYPEFFCYPGGGQGIYDRRAVALVKAHYKYAFTTYFGLIPQYTSPYALSRCHIESGWTPADVRLSTSLLWMLKHRKIGIEYINTLAAA